MAAGSAAHTHAYRMTLHLDGCHFYESHFACSCGAQVETYDERSVKDDPYSAIWMDPEGMEKPCDRCQALMAGADPVHRKTGNEKAGLS